MEYQQDYEDMEERPSGKPRDPNRPLKIVIIVLLVVMGIFVLTVIGLSIYRSQTASDLPSEPVSESNTSMVTTAPETTLAATEPPTTEEETTVVETTAVPETKAPDANAISPIDGSVLKTVTIDPDKWYLTLVNREYVLPSDFKCETVDLKGGYDLDYRAAEYYNAMYDAAKKDGITLNVVSGYRRIVKQDELYKNRVKRCMNEDGLSYEAALEAAARWVLPPGTSEHNLGLAVDIGWLTADFEDSAAYAWLEEHAADYGFVLRYPKDKVDITKINYEPWHWRYIGVEDAKKLKAMGTHITLEEYLGVA